jgi:hypothetical protein
MWPKDDIDLSQRKIERQDIFGGNPSMTAEPAERVLRWPMSRSIMLRQDPILRALYILDRGFTGEGGVILENPFLHC